MSELEHIPFHDYHLRGYTVGEYGRLVTLDLRSGSEPEPTTTIHFTEVETYRFLHTGGAIITYMMEVPFREAVREMKLNFPEDFRLHGGMSVSFPTNEEYGEHFVREGFKTWLILSAIGFAGVIVGKYISSPQAHRYGN